ncbi:hypothetical protein C0J50_2564 [Silurus asotus]|uniref:Limbin n=1 Tax=Silurus asotus TaxID=30991 RepID=A0AAD5B6F6_SILAS|nr:hypothetical protein C0J50_2564 [Silurus asotus]
MTLCACAESLPSTPVRWSRATCSYYCACCVLLSSARAVHRHHDAARARALKPEDSVRDERVTAGQMGSAVKSTELGIQFLKCAQVVTESEFPLVNVYLVVKNLEDGIELSQLSIRDTISDLISMQSNGKVEDKQYQTFSTDTLHAGSSYSVSYTVCAAYALHFAGFCVAFLISTLLLSFALLTASCFYKKCLMRTRHHAERRSFCVEAEPEEAVSNTSDTASEDAAFEDRIIDIMALEDPQDMLHSLDNLEMSCLLRGAVMAECLRAQMLKGMFRVLTASVGGNEVSMVDLLSHVTDMQEDQKSQLNTHTAMEACAERQDADHRRLEALRRREELHGIICEEIEEAAMSGGTHLANQLLHRYYTCQDQLESLLDLFIANQSAALSEQHAQRRFLLQGLQDLQRSMCDMFSVFSRHIDSWFGRIRREGVLSDQHCVQQLEHVQSELQRVRKSFEETLVRERSSAHCDIIKTRRARIADALRAGSVVGGCLADTEAELGVRKREAAKTLRLTRSTIQQIREQELKQQKERRERIHTFCRSVWEGQCSLSEIDVLRLQLEYVKSACHLDRCLWDKAERKNRVLETHSAMLTLQMLLMQTVSCTPVEEELSHAIHTHSLALEEAELLFQKEESEWERSMDAHGHNELLNPDEEDSFRVNTECPVAECLQEALCKRQQLTHTLTER